MGNRRIILLGRNATNISDERHIEVFAGKEIETGGVLLDPFRKRAYQIRAQSEGFISVRELDVCPQHVKSLRPLDDLRAVGNIIEWAVRIIARRKRGTNGWSRF